MVVKKKSTEPSTRFKEIRSRITPVQELPLIISALFYGKSGSGKTTVAASFPKPALILDIREKGTDSVYDVEDLDVFPVETWDDIEQVYWMLKKEGHYKTVILDQITTLQDLCQRTVMEEESKTQMSLRLFGETSSRMKTWILNYRDLIDEGIHVVFLSHDRTFGGDDEGEDEQIDPTVGPRLMPSIASMVCGAVKIVGCTFIQEKLGEKDPKTRQRERSVRYCMRIGAHGTYTTKLRVTKSTQVPRIMINPSFDKLVAIMRNEGESEPIKPVVQSRIKRSVVNG